MTHLPPTHASVFYSGGRKSTRHSYTLSSSLLSAPLKHSPTSLTRVYAFVTPQSFYLSTALVSLSLSPFAGAYSSSSLFLVSPTLTVTVQLNHSVV